MSRRERELAERRAALLEQTQAQREHLAFIARDIEQRLAGIDRGIEMARSLAKKPIVIAGAVALIAWIRPRRLLRVASRAAGLIATSRRAVKLLRG